jgi:uncharacterized protein (TIGR00730 family)
MLTKNQLVELPPYEDKLDEYVTRWRHSRMSSSRKRKCAMLFAEAVEAMDTLSRADRTIAIFGAAREPSGSEKYNRTAALAEMLGRAGYDILQGDGPGHMEAAALGAVRAGRRAFGLTIISASTFEKEPNPYTTHHILQHNMFTRKFAFLEADGFVFMDYGIGTLDEHTEVVTQLQLGLMQRKPAVCFGTKEWGKIQLLLTQLVEEGKMSPADLELFSVTDDPEQVVSILLKACPPTTIVE